KKIPRAQDLAIRALLSSSTDNNSTFLEHSKEDRFLQYYLTSYQLKYGRKHSDYPLYFPVLPSTPPEKLKEKFEFEIDKYLKSYTNYSIIEGSNVIFKIETSTSDCILPNPHRSAEMIIPPHTKFEVVKTETKEESSVFGIRKPKTTRTIITVKIIAQKDPVMPKEEELTEMVENAYETSRKAQLDIWERFMQNRNISVCFSEEETQGKHDVEVVKLWAPQLQYLNLVAQVQRQKMDEKDIDYLDDYTFYGYSDPNRINKEAIHAIFDKIDSLKRSLIVFRSMDDDEMASICESYKNEEIFKNFEECAKDNNDFLSVSVDPYVAMAYCQQEGRPEDRPKGNGLLKLTIPAGKKALAAELTTSSHTANKEFILRREGLKIKVDKITEKDGFSFIEATVV
ncbi:MAG: hypothetical protein Q4D57_05470, partial [Clostridia bacterium]|nr:hypothetical protein [Clostridia bacterium]